jgi:hypothetical protein
VPLIAVARVVRGELDGHQAIGLGIQHIGIAGHDLARHLRRGVHTHAAIELHHQGIAHGAAQRLHLHAHAVHAGMRLRHRRKVGLH